MLFHSQVNGKSENPVMFQSTNQTISVAPHAAAQWPFQQMLRFSPDFEEGFGA
jgi:hypothetical protein